MMQKVFCAVAAQFTRLGEMIWRRNPVSVMRHLTARKKRAVQDAREQLAHIRAAGSQMETIRSAHREKVQDLEHSIDAALRSGNITAAERFALERKTTLAAIDKISADHDLLVSQYHSSREACITAQDEIRHIENRIIAGEARLGAARAREAGDEVLFALSDSSGSMLAEANSALEDEVILLNVRHQVRRDLVSPTPATRGVDRELARGALEEYRLSIADDTARNVNLME